MNITLEHTINEEPQETTTFLKLLPEVAIISDIGDVGTA